MQSQLELMEKACGIEWHEYKIEDIFIWQQNIAEINPLHLDSLSLSNEKLYPFYGQAIVNNGIIEYRHLQDNVLNNKFGKPTILIHSNNQNIVYLDTPFYLKDGHGATSVLQAEGLNSLTAQFLITIIRKVITQKYSYNAKATKTELKKTIITLPTITKNGKKIIAYNFMEKFVSVLYAERVSTLKVERLATLEAYLTATGLCDYTLANDEQKALDEFNAVNYGVFNIKNLYGKSSRGSRLKSADRIDGDLPFVTAGEYDMGISAYIGNNVKVFYENTVTIDMFGSSKYRNYKYGADDHVAIVHSENIPKFAALYLTAAIHKSSYAGQFDYSRNFYASDADELNISLPVNPDNTPDYSHMSLVISATQKIVIKNLVDHLDMRISKTEEILQ